MIGLQTELYFVNAMQLVEDNDLQSILTLFHSMEAYLEPATDAREISFSMEAHYFRVIS